MCLFLDQSIWFAKDIEVALKSKGLEASTTRKTLNFLENGCRWIKARKCIDSDKLLWSPKLGRMYRLVSASEATVLNELETTD